MSGDLTQILIVVVLSLAALLGILLVIALALLVKTFLELFALARTVRAEVGAVAAAIRGAGERLAGGAGALSSVLGAVRGAKKPAAKRAKK